jgi:dTDP-4-dehydrorhamnose 3,5-epimerase
MVSILEEGSFMKNYSDKISSNEVKLIEPNMHYDQRGWFYVAYNADQFEKKYDFIQDNHSFSNEAGTLRGLHYQLPPFEQSKLIRVIAGSILDIVVDVRPESNTFLEWQSFLLNSEEKKSLLIPKGFAHGFITLSDKTEVYYKVDEKYSPENEITINYDDPSLMINWGNVNIKSISKKDLSGISIKEFKILLRAIK